MSSENLVIAISRQCGSMGRVIGQKLAEELGIKCYDKELLAIASKNSGFCEELFKTHDEKPTKSFLYSLVMDTYSTGFGASGYSDMPINHQIFLAQFDTIRNLADEESCVFIGRCADYALEEYPNLVSVFISADEEDRIQTLKEIHGLTAGKAKDLMIKTDKNRSSYYNYYANKKWGDIKSYDLCVNRSTVGVDGAVKIIRDFAELKMAWKKEKDVN